METPALCAGNSPVTGEFPHKGQWHGALMFSLICAWINGRVNYREAGDSRCHHAHYDVTIMLFCSRKIPLCVLCCLPACVACMMSLWLGSAFRITGPLCGESSSHLCVPSQRASNENLWWLLCCWPEQVFNKQSRLVIWNASITQLTLRIQYNMLWYILSYCVLYLVL